MARHNKPVTAGLRSEWNALCENYNRTKAAMNQIAATFDPSVHVCCPACAFPRFQQLLTRNQNRENRIHQIAARISQAKISEKEN